MKTGIFGWFEKRDVIERSAHDALMAEKDVQIAIWKTQTEGWKLMYDQAMAPKQEPVSPPVLTLEPREPSQVAQAIREMAQGDSRLSEHLHQQKRELRAKHPNMSDDGIIALLCKWETSEELLDAEMTG